MCFPSMLQNASFPCKYLVATCNLENGEPYVNPGIHVIKLRWGKAYDFDVYEDTFAVTAGLEKQAKSGIAEASAPQIVS